MEAPSEAAVSQRYNRHGCRAGCAPANAAAYAQAPAVPIALHNGAAQQRWPGAVGRRAVTLPHCHAAFRLEYRAAQRTHANIRIWSPLAAPNARSDVCGPF